MNNYEVQRMKVKKKVKGISEKESAINKEETNFDC
jgi:hypothetical protein